MKIARVLLLLTFTDSSVYVSKRKTLGTCMLISSLYINEHRLCV